MAERPPGRSRAGRHRRAAALTRLAAGVLAYLTFGTLACLAAAKADAAAGPGSRHAVSSPRPRKPAKPPRPITLEWVGDIAMSTQNGLPPGGVLGATAPEHGFLHSADLTIGNLEGTLGTGGPSKCPGGNGGSCFAFQAPPSYAFGLRQAGFDVVNQANNHSMDYGAPGRAQTLQALAAAHIAETGLPGQITYLTVRRTRIAFLGFAPYANTSNLLDIPSARAMVARAHRHAAIVVVIIHAGAEGGDRLHTPAGEEYYIGEDRGNPRAFAHEVVDAGATVVLGSGPHVIRGIETYRGRLVAYSLGNFIGYHTLGGGGVLSLSGILRVSLDPTGRLTAARWFSIQLSEGLPFPDPSNAAARLAGRLSGEDFPADHPRILDDGFFSLPRPRGRR